MLDLSLGIVGKLLAPPDEHERMETTPKSNSRQQPKLSSAGGLARAVHPKSLKTRPAFVHSVALAACSRCRRFLLSVNSVKKYYEKVTWINQEVNSLPKWREFPVHRHNSVHRQYSVSPAASSVACTSRPLWTVIGYFSEAPSSNCLDTVTHWLMLAVS